jgi:hypothetical protein
MFHFFEAITNTKGDALSGYFVRLTDSSGNVVPIYADSSGTPIVNVSGEADMAKVDANGNVSLYVNPGEYTLNIFAADAATMVPPTIPNYPMGLNTITLASGSSVSTRTALAAIALPIDGQKALFDGSQWDFSTADLSSQVAADTQQGIYVAPSTDTTGASGAWVRKYSGPAHITWFGADTAATSSANKTAIQAAVNVAKYIRVPNGTFASTGGIVAPSDAFVCGPGTIDFDASATTHWMIFGAASGSGSVSVSNIHIVGVNFICNDDVAFATFLRFENSGGTTDRVFILDNTITYSGVPSTGDDRWFIAASSGTIGAPTWSNVQIIGNTLDGPMQLVANAANSNSKHWEIAHNKIHNARANAIFVSTGSGVANNPATAEDFNIHHNQIWADAYTSCGILIGLDSSAGDRDVNLRRIRVSDNTIYLGWAGGTWGIGFRGGNDCSGIGGFASDMSGIVVQNNIIYTQAGQDAIHFETATITTAAAAYFTDTIISGNLVLQGNVSIGGMSEAGLKGNTLRGNLLLTQTSLVLRSSANTLETLVPATAASFELHSDGDRFVGHAPSVAVDEYPIDLAPASGATQTLYLNHATVNSRKTDTTRRKSAVRTSGLGTATVTVRRLATDTTWNAGLYTATTGTITDYDRKTSYTPTLTANLNCSALGVTKATYFRSEQYVTVNAVITGTASAASLVKLDVSLPVASTLATSADLIGTCVTVAASPVGGYIQGVTGSNVGRLAFIPPSGAFTLTVSFQYEVK